MPSSYAHLRFGGEVLPRLPEFFRTAVQTHRKLYDLGTHGPDIFFFFRPGIPTRTGALGHDYHYGNTKSFFGSIGRRLRLSPSREGYAYLAGLLSHYALDSQCHPFVKEAEAGHMEAETEFDRFLLETDGLLLPKPHFSLDHLHLTPGESTLLTAFYPKASAEKIRESAAAMAFFLNRSMLPKGNVSAVTQRVLGRNASRFLLTPEPNPRCRETNQKLLQLYGEAAERFCVLCSQMAAYLTRSVPLGEEFDPIFG